MRTKHAINNILLQTTTLVSGIVLYFFLTPYIVATLGKDVYGINQLLLQTVGYFGIAELGIGISLSVLLYKELANNHTQNINALLSAAQRIYMFIGGSIASTGLVFSFFLSNLFSIPDAYILDTQIAFLIYIASAACSYFASVPAILLNTSQRGYKTYVFQLAKPFLTYGFYVLFVYNGFSIIGIAFTSFFITVWSLYVTNRKVRSEFPWINIWQKTKDYTILNTSKYVFIEKLLMLVLFQTDIILISYFLGIEEVASYALYTVFFYYIKELIIIGSYNIINGSGELYQQGEIAKVFQLWRDAMSIAFFIAIQVCVGIYFIYPYFFKLWMNNELLLSNTVLLFFTINLFYIITLHPTATILGSQNYYKMRIKGAVAEISVNIVISCLLIQHLGVLGALIGTTIGHYFVNAWFIPMLFFQSIQMKFNTYLKIAIRYIAILTLVGSANYMLFYLGVPYLENIDTWLMLLVACVGYLLFSIPLGILLFRLFDLNYKHAHTRIRGIISIASPLKK